MYHTQEKREDRLVGPKSCNRKDAWLGIGYYFWDEEVDAISWGHSSKRKTGYFEIYSASIDCEDVLDTVFNEEHYNFWRTQIEKVAKVITIKTGHKPTIKEVNTYITEKAKWTSNITGVLFQDLPYSDDLLVEKFNYRKRIQIAVFNIKIVDTFVFQEEMQCN